MAVGIDIARDGGQFDGDLAVAVVFHGEELTRLVAGRLHAHLERRDLHRLGRRREGEEGEEGETSGKDRPCAHMNCLVAAYLAVIEKVRVSA